MKFQKNVGL